MRIEKEHFKLWTDWRLYFIILCIVLVSEFIGPINFSIGPGVVSLLPMLTAFLIGLGLYFTPIIKQKQSNSAGKIMTIAISLLLAKIGGIIAPSISTILEVGPALLLQEAGNLLTIFLGLPVAIFLGLKRESIGLTCTLGRDGVVALITEKFGFDSPEARGVLAMYVFGTMFGALFLGMFASFLAAFTPLHPLSLAMASGVGSASMMSAASGSLVEAFPAMENDIIALAGASNLISTVTGLFVATFIALPLTIKLYNLLSRHKYQLSGRKTKKKAKMG